MDKDEKRRQYHNTWNHRRLGYGRPVASLVRSCETFHAALLVRSDENTDLLVERWLCHDGDHNLCNGVDEATARAMIKKWEKNNEIN